jgi:hypothetical protein
MQGLPCLNEPGQLFNYSGLLVGMKKAAMFRVRIFDPN